MTPANISDNRGARELLSGFTLLMPLLGLIWADGAYADEKLQSWFAKLFQADPEEVREVGLKVAMCALAEEEPSQILLTLISKNGS